MVNNRYYFDFNATSPVLSVVKGLISGGDVAFANPSSTHHEGKKAKAVLEDCQDELYRIFGLKEKDFDLIFHSGATEGINSIVKGASFALDKLTFVYVKTDHSSVRTQQDFLKAQGHKVLPMDVNSAGEYDLDSFISLLKKEKNPILVNWTWVNNETGVVFKLEDALKIKEETGALIHVDAVQSVGKIKEWRNLLDTLDGHTYSGHKFGALKGVGFSFLKKRLPHHKHDNGRGATERTSFRNGKCPRC